MVDRTHAVVHFEIPANDVERAQSFYGDIFGWQIQRFDMPADGSTAGEPYYLVHTTETDEEGMVQTPGAINGGMMKRVHPNQVFMNYISVTDIDATLKKITEKGGNVCMPKTAIAENMGWIASFTDPEGNIMGLHQMSPKA